MADEQLEDKSEETEQTATDTPYKEGDDEGVEASTIETTGVVIEDEQGHKWTIPDDKYDDLDDLGASNPFGNLKLDPVFHYQLCHSDEVPKKMTEGLVVVTRDEVGLPPTLELEYGKPQSTIVAMLDGVLMKIPKILADRRQAKKLRIAKAVVEATEPTPEMLARARRAGKHPLMKSLSEMSMNKDGSPIEATLKRRKSAHLTR